MTQSSRQKEKSEFIRRSHGWLTADEIKAKKEAKILQDQTEAKESAKGISLFGDSE